jgi:hypothetical protein
MENNFESVNKSIEWHTKINEVLSSLEKGISFEYLPTEKDEIQFCIETLDSFIEHNEEKYRDKEGKEFFHRIKNYKEKIIALSN